MAFRRAASGKSMRPDCWLVNTCLAEYALYMKALRLIGILGSIAFHIAVNSSAGAQSIIVPDEPQPILPLDEVRIGMKGYGLTVFHGTKIEPFEVEVVSVMRDFEPKKGVIWVRCDHPELNISGPVQGMSGSPIYLWDESVPGNQRRLGQNGKLIGAFAFGYGGILKCYAGIQPIEQMRAVSGRVNDEKIKEAVGGHGGGIGGQKSKAVGSEHNIRMVLEGLNEMNLDPAVAWRGRAVAELIAPPATRGQDGVRKRTSPPLPNTLPGESVNMLLPLRLPNKEVARMYAPFFERAGLMPMAAPAGQVGQPPVEVDMENTTIQPGSMLSIPLGYGDMDMSASGTVTDVLPDGRVLAFGHAMFGEGDVSMPLATCFVHYVVPLRTISFKLSGSVSMVGSVVRDESSGIAGVGDKTYTTAPVNVAVRMPGQPEQNYSYHVVHHPQLTPQIAASAVASSVGALRNPPAENTTRIRSTLTFSSGHAFSLDTLVPEASVGAAGAEVAPLIAALINNPYQEIELESLNVEVDVEDKLRNAVVVAARMERPRVAPGESVDLLLDLKTKGEEPRTVRIRLNVPEDLDEGEYPVIIAGGQFYSSLLFSAKPHLQQHRSLDQLADVVKQILDVPSDKLFVVMQLPETELAVNNTELEKLPSAQKAILAARTTTAVTPYRELYVQEEDLDLVFTGQFQFVISVRESDSIVDENE